MSMILNPYRYAAGGANDFNPESEVSSAEILTWLEPDSYNGMTNVWEDKSTQGNDWTAAVGFEPSVVSGGPEYNSQDVVQFSDHYLIGPNLSSLTEAEVFILLDIDADPPQSGVQTGLYFLASLGSHYPWVNGTIYDGFCSNSRKTVGNPTESLTDPRVVNIWSASSDWNYNLDSSSLYSTVSNTVTGPATTYLGRSDGGGGPFYLRGRIRAFILYDGKLSASDRAAVYNYLDVMRA